MDKSRGRRPASLPAEPGTYALLLRATHELSIEVGRLGLLAVRTGWYVYVGSALGPGGLAARVGRHLRPGKPCRWHVDYLRAVTEPEAVWYAVGAGRQECRWAEAFARMGGANVPLVGFGASDCGCQSHLFQFATQPQLRAFRREMAEVIGLPTTKPRSRIKSVDGLAARTTASGRIPPSVSR